jgi:hypothetical protein
MPKPSKRPDWFEDLIESILEAFHGHKPKERVRFGWKVGMPVNKSKNMPLDLSITNEQKIQVTLNPVTATGRPAKVDGAPQWSVITGGATLDVAADGLSAFLVSADDPGDTEFLVKADANLGDGVEEISDTIRLSVAGANAANLGLVAGTAVPK